MQTLIIQKSLNRRDSFSVHRIRSMNNELGRQPERPDAHADQNRESSSMQNERCPYCVQGDDFKLMLWFNGYFICTWCGHKIIPARPDFQCPCPKCQDLRRE